MLVSKAGSKKKLWLTVVLLACGLLLAAISRLGCFVTEEKVESKSINHDMGWCYVFLPKLSQSHWKYLLTTAPDDVNRLTNSKLEIYENGKALGPAHSKFEDIREVGMGRFCHWRNYVYFSSTDNTDPANNSRNYVVVYPLIVKLRAILILIIAMGFCLIYIGKQYRDSSGRV